MYDEIFTRIRVLDVESTGLIDPSEMVELGYTDIVRFPDGWATDGEPKSFIVNPGMPISFGAMAVHHIREAYVVDGMNPDEARRYGVKGAVILCAHNVEHDKRYIHGHKLPWICTFKVAKTVWPDMESYGNGALRYALGLCLDPASDALTQPSHRAGPDTWVTAHILLEQLKLLPIEKMIEISENPLVLKFMPFGKHKGVKFWELPYEYLDWIVNKSDMPNEKGKEDIVYTARRELGRRAAA
jgi:exodeoxyribonuclease X